MPLGLIAVGYALRRGVERARQGQLGSAALQAASALVAIPAWFIAISMAESASGWVDKDGDGMLDGFSAGAYDWVDLNGLDFGIYWTFIVVFAVVVTEVALRRGAWILGAPHGEQ